MAWPGPADARSSLQTWVDDAGTYLDFTGRWSGGRMTFSRTFTASGKPVIQRMVFHDIKADGLVWEWETSRHEGKTWRLMRQLNYRRKTHAPPKAGMAFDGNSHLT